MKQTAVEWLEDKVSQILDFDLIKLFEQAKEMEKQQIIDACQHGVDYDKSPYNNAEQYYNETYKSE
jgi:hypothetical protein